MAANDRNQKIRQLKEKLEICKDFIKNGQKETEKDLAECQKDYQDVCRELDRTKKDYQRELKQAQIEHYSTQQMQTMEKWSRKELHWQKNIRIRRSSIYKTPKSTWKNCLNF